MFIINNYSKIADEIIKKEEKYSQYSDTQLSSMTQNFKSMLLNGSTEDDILVDAFAVVREVSKRVLGMSHFKTQLIGGLVLKDGKIAEMKTGEGKTLVATCPAYLKALTGLGVHIITVNDYLSKTNSDQMGKIFNFLKLSVSCITEDTPLHKRKSLYLCDIVYGTNKEFGFDYLRDNMCKSKEDITQRDFNFCIIDEADSILIDEARTPLIIAGDTSDSDGNAKEANSFSLLLSHSTKEEDEDKVDFIIKTADKNIYLTELGLLKVESHFNTNHNDIGYNDIIHSVLQALKANYLMTNGKDYIVKKDEVMLVDPMTGRVMDGRRFTDGLHQALEAKEKVIVQKESITFASITLQNYFKMYTRISGMTGTAITEKKEFKRIYDLKVVEIPTHKPVIRKDYPDRIFATNEEKYNAILDLINNNNGRPILIGTSSILSSENLSNFLNSKHIKHQVLNAKQHEKEALIVSQAGRLNAITIATNMAGRGTDILLGGNPEQLALNKLKTEEFSKEAISIAPTYEKTSIEEYRLAQKKFREYTAEFKKETNKEKSVIISKGGLLVIGTERHDSRRVDNQLRGRAGRQGDPGETVFLISLEDALFKDFGWDNVSKYIDKYSSRKTPLSQCFIRKTNKIQKKIEKQNFEIRKNVFDYDKVINIQRKEIYSFRTSMYDNANATDFLIQSTPFIANNIMSRFFPEQIISKKSFISFQNYISVICPLVQMKYSNNFFEIQNCLKENILESINNVRKKPAIYTMSCRATQSVIDAVDSVWIAQLQNIDALKLISMMSSYGTQKPINQFKEYLYKLYKDMMYEIFELSYIYFILQSNSQIRKALDFASPATISRFRFKDLKNMIQENLQEKLKNGEKISITDTVKDYIDK